jgi:hypothetical protein
LLGNLTHLCSSFRSILPTLKMIISTIVLPWSNATGIPRDRYSSVPLLLGVILAGSYICKLDRKQL